MAVGELTARVLTRFYLDRILRLDQQGPALNAVIELSPDALQVVDGLARREVEGLARAITRYPCATQSQHRYA